MEIGSRCFQKPCGNNLFLGAITHFTLETPPKSGPATEAQTSPWKF